MSAPKLEIDVLGSMLPWLPVAALPIWRVAPLAIVTTGTPALNPPRAPPLRNVALRVLLAVALLEIVTLTPGLIAVTMLERKPFDTTRPGVLPISSWPTKRFEVSDMATTFDPAVVVMVFTELGM